MGEIDKDELGFYINFTRPLIFSLTEQKDRVHAASWVKKIKNDESASEKLKTDYIKLLLFALQRRKLLGIFEEDPESYEKLPPFPLEYDLNLMAKNILEAEIKERKDRIRKQLKGDIGDSPPYTTDFSPNLKEFVAAQDIPGFGVHCFYAMSKEPLSSWKKTDKIIPPKLAKSVVNTMTAVPEDIKAEASTSCVCPPKDTPEGEPSECKTRFKSPEEKKPKRKKYGSSPPSPPLGKPPPPDDRDTPQWGSNLTEVKELPLQSDKPTASAGAIPKVKGKAIKIIYDEDSSVDEIEQALKDFRRGEVSGIFRKCKTIPKDDSEEEIPPEDIGSPYQSVAGSLMPRDQYEEWRQEHLDRSFWQEGVEEDYPLVDYLKHSLAREEAKKHLVDLHKMAHSSEPARAGLPVTTPRLSPSPKRVQSSEKLYKEDDDDLPPLQQADGTQTKPASTEADENLYKLHEDMLAAVAEEDERIQREQMEIDMELERQEIENQEMEMQMAQQREKEKPEGQKKEVRIEPGSPAANRLFADYLHSIHKDVRQAAETRFESYEGVNENVDLSDRPSRKSGIPGPKTRTPLPRTGIPKPAGGSGTRIGRPPSGIPKPPSGIPTARSGSDTRICRPPSGVPGPPSGIPTARSGSRTRTCRPPSGVPGPPSGIPTARSGSGTRICRPPSGVPGPPSGIPTAKSGSGTRICRPPSGVPGPPSGIPTARSGSRTRTCRPPSGVQGPPSGIPTARSGSRTRTCRPPSGVQGPPSGIPTARSGSGTRICRPRSGIPKPPSGIPRPPSGIPRPPSGVPRPTSRIPQTPSGISRPSSKIGQRPTGLPQPGFSKTVQRGIRPPQPPRQFKPPSPSYTPISSPVASPIRLTAEPICVCAEPPPPPRPQIPLSPLDLEIDYDERLLMDESPPQIGELAATPQLVKNYFDSRYFTFEHPTYDETLLDVSPSPPPSPVRPPPTPGSPIRETPRVRRLPCVDPTIEKPKRRKRTTAESRRRKIDFNVKEEVEWPYKEISPIKDEIRSPWPPRNILDESLPRDLPAAMQPPTTLYGWSTPEEFKIRERERKMAEAPQYELPPAYMFTSPGLRPPPDDPTQYFFETEQFEELSPSQYSPPGTRVPELHIIPPTPTSCPCHSPAHSLTPVFSPPLKLQPGDESFFSSPYTPDRRARELLGSISPHPMPPPTPDEFEVMRQMVEQAEGMTPRTKGRIKQRRRPMMTPIDEGLMDLYGITEPVSIESPTQSMMEIAQTCHPYTPEVHEDVAMQMTEGEIMPTEEGSPPFVPWALLTPGSGIDDTQPYLADSPISSFEECPCDSSTVNHPTFSRIPEDYDSYSTYGMAVYSPALSEISGIDYLDDTFHPEGFFDDTPGTPILVDVPGMECECAIMENQHSFQGFDDSLPSYLPSPMMPQNVEHIHGTITIGSPLGQEGAPTGACPGNSPRRVASRTFTSREFITDNE